ncbi:MAG: molecular chaperone DnaK [Candidatus Scalindua rubra]|uniref:Chaperone protein DnaK n=1 Tax=Candidatus Scalindua rubra TaxID=1872076 RepID=A0A1E3XCX5_9BACT|nr:MAG: molecular chaperone DnaK [Candidatus Scalindua rubra]
MSKVIGIDLGTTFSLAAYLEGGQPKIIPNVEGSRMTPSVVSILKDGKRLVGQLAKLQATGNPDGTVFSIKRHMGRRAYLDLDSLSDDKEIIRQIKRHMGSDYWVKIDDKEYTPEEISAMILQKIKKDTEDYLGEKIEKTVISVPAYFNISQRQATIDAGRIAGIEVLRIIDEPTSAALAYGLDMEDIHTILVWDLGGGTFDVSILELGGGVFEVKAVNGDTWLGGDDYDYRIVEHLANEFQEEYGIDLRKNKVAMIRLKEVAEKAKIDLTDKEVTRIKIPFINAGEGGPKHWETVLTREKFEELTDDLLQKMVEPTKQALTDARLKPRDIDRVILVGGSTRMPAVRHIFKDLMGKEPYVEIHPDEVVAMGASVQAGILTGQIEGKILIDVTPISLGIETQGGIFTKIIERNTTIPTSESRLFTNAADQQTSMDIHVLQGERPMAIYNMTLDRFQMTGIPPLPRGDAWVEVKFEINANGILHVSCKDLHTENSRRLRISPRFYGIPSEEIERMIMDAREYQKQDQRECEEVEISIKADNMIRAGQQMIEDVGEEGDPSLPEQETGLIDPVRKVISNGVEDVEKAMLEVRTALAGEDYDDIKSRTEELERRIKALDRVFKKTRSQRQEARI